MSNGNHLALHPTSVSGYARKDDGAIVLQGRVVHPDGFEVTFAWNTKDGTFWWPRTEQGAFKAALGFCQNVVDLVKQSAEMKVVYRKLGGDLKLFDKLEA